MSTASPSPPVIQHASQDAETTPTGNNNTGAASLVHDNASPKYRLVPETELLNPSTLSLSRLDPKSQKPLATLNPSVHGWSRRPLGDTRLFSGPGAFFRNKRWEYYGIMTPSHIVGITISSLDYVGVNQLFILSRDSLSVTLSREIISPLARGVNLPETYGDSASFASKELSISIAESQTETDRVTHITAHSTGTCNGEEKREKQVSLDLTLSRPKDSDALHVVVPWNDPKRFQYTIKEPAIPVSSGQLVLDGVVYPISDAFAVLDHGRGRWPYSMAWNWAAGSGISPTGQRVGFSIGGKWTEGTGSTENAIIMNGRLTKISEELNWEYDTTNWMKPWRITGKDLELTFTPFYDRVAKTNLLVLSGETHQLFGRWSGVFRAQGGGEFGNTQEISLDGLEGWAEEARNRW